VVAHGGSGTILGALAHGLPLLVVPQGADQHANADAIVEAGAGRCLARDETTVDAIRDSVRALLRNPGHRVAAQRVRAEIEAMPTAAETVSALRSLIAPAAEA
jgi:UDP:flavonoid glycosyltransferase YjiC (YdhE family)